MIIQFLIISSFNPEWQKADFSTVPDDVKNLTLHKRQTELSIRDRSILKVIRLGKLIHKQ